MNKFPKLFIPGPTHVSDEILEAFSTPQIGHRTPEISKLISELVSGIQEVLYTKNHIYLVSHPATGLWEMAIRNGVKRKVLHCVNGAFSNKWALVTKEVGLDYDVIDYKWGKPVLSSDIRKKLESGKYDAVALVHNETSTGVMSDLNQIGLMMEDFPDVSFLVDAVSSMSGIKILVDSCNIDFIFASTQKAWGLPAGFSVASVSDKFISKSKSIKNRGYILNTDIYEKYYDKNQTPYTPSIPHMFGLKKALELIFKEGIENRWSRHIDMANIVREWALEMGQSLYADQGAQSYTVTSINNDRNWNINELNDKLLSKGFRMDRGYGKLKGKVFRIAHMGNIFKQDLLEYLHIFKKVVDE
ncbi:MAG: aminotransferase [Candidatus Marinimicrobia bacterium]|nr:aminotransferase [Candidatus Neomarinimicrobiota bacterium]